MTNQISKYKLIAVFPKEFELVLMRAGLEDPTKQSSDTWYYMGIFGAVTSPDCRVPSTGRTVGILLKRDFYFETDEIHTFEFRPIRYCDWEDNTRSDYQNTSCPSRLLARALNFPVSTNYGARLVHNDSHWLYDAQMRGHWYSIPKAVYIKTLSNQRSSTEQDLYPYHLFSLNSTGLTLSWLQNAGIAPTRFPKAYQKPNLPCHQVSGHQLTLSTPFFYRSSKQSGAYHTKGTAYKVLSPVISEPEWSYNDVWDNKAQNGFLRETFGQLLTQQLQYRVSSLMQRVALVLEDHLPVLLSNPLVMENPLTQLLLSNAIEDDDTWCSRNTQQPMILAYNDLAEVSLNAVPNPDESSLKTPKKVLSELFKQLERLSHYVKQAVKHRTLADYFSEWVSPLTHIYWEQVNPRLPLTVRAERKYTLSEASDALREMAYETANTSELLFAFERKPSPETANEIADNLGMCFPNRQS